jgi:hypothetical protein
LQFVQLAIVTTLIGGWASQITKVKQAGTGYMTLANCIQGTNEHGFSKHEAGKWNIAQIFSV